MKVIALMPVRNEAWILRRSLAALSEFCDVILVADQRSEDGSRAIIASFKKCSLIENPHQGHSNKIRWDLLEAARDFDGENLILNIDADEMIPPSLFKEFLARGMPGVAAGSWLSFWWVQLWRSPLAYCAEGVWSNLWKPVGFLDDRVLAYNRNVVLNDHTSRVPGSAATKTARVESAPLLHFQWVNFDRVQMKQSWYRCQELLSGRWLPGEINQRYGITKEEGHVKTAPCSPIWINDLDLKTFETNSAEPSWHLKEIKEMIGRYGIAFFEPLDIWHVPALHALFLNATGREPRIASPLSAPRRLIRRATSLLRRWKK